MGGQGRQEALPATSIARARKKQLSLVPGGAGLLESMVELRTGCSVHQLLYKPKENKMVDETLTDQGFKATDFGSDLQLLVVLDQSFSIGVQTITKHCG